MPIADSLGRVQGRGEEVWLFFNTDPTSRGGVEEKFHAVAAEVKAYYDKTAALVREAEEWMAAGRPLVGNNELHPAALFDSEPENRIFDYIQITTVAGCLFLGVARAALLYTRGARVVVVDWQRTGWQMLGDSVMALALLCYFYLVLAYAWPLPAERVPSWGSGVLFDAPATKIAGAVLLCGGTIIYVFALWTMGVSWRIGIDRQSPGDLVTSGIFAISRNPIYLAFDLMIVGTFLVQGRIIFAVLALVIVALIHETILREEKFLAIAYGGAYRDYRSRVGRYVTWIRSKR